MTRRTMTDFKTLLALSAFALTAIGCEAIDSSSQSAGTASQAERSQEFSTAWPNLSEPVATSEFSEAGIKALESRMAQFVDDGHTAGIATLLVKSGEVIHYADHGLRNPFTGAEVTEDTIYRIYSMTKPVTGVALMMLVEEGKISLDDPVDKYIPELSDMQVLASYEDDGTFTTAPVNRAPTIRELMSHTAGFAYGLSGTDPANQAFREKQVLQSPDFGTFIDRVSTIPLLFQPGTNWYYSVSVDIQGVIVERVSGMKFGEFLETRLFAPLGMDDTGFFVPDEDYDRFSDVWGYHPETKEIGPYRVPMVAFRANTIGMESGGGGLVSTMRDYARFCQMLANGGVWNGNRLLKEETVKLMRQNVVADDIHINVTGNLTREQAAGIGFGLDFGVIKDAEASPSPYGQDTYYWGGAAGTWFWIDPEHDLFFIGMIQRFPANGPTIPFRTVSAELVYGAKTD